MTAFFIVVMKSRVREISVTIDDDPAVIAFARANFRDKQPFLVLVIYICVVLLTV